MNLEIDEIGPSDGCELSEVFRLFGDILVSLGTTNSFITAINSSDKGQQSGQPNLRHNLTQPGTPRHEQ